MKGRGRPRGCNGNRRESKESEELHGWYLQNSAGTENSVARGRRLKATKLLRATSGVTGVCAGNAGPGQATPGWTQYNEFSITAQQTVLDRRHAYLAFPMLRMLVGWKHDVMAELSTLRTMTADS